MQLDPELKPTPPAKSNRVTFFRSWWDKTGVVAHDSEQNTVQKIPGSPPPVKKGQKKEKERVRVLAADHTEICTVEMDAAYSKISSEWKTVTQRSPTLSLPENDLQSFNARDMKKLGFIPGLCDDKTARHEVSEASSADTLTPPKPKAMTPAPEGRTP